jgi:hypothetical protein
MLQRDEDGDYICLTCGKVIEAYLGFQHCSTGCMLADILDDDSYITKEKEPNDAD